jgi:hypothetical protein
MCQRILAVPVAARGKLVRCRSCATTLRIPAKLEPAAPTDESAKAKKDDAAG